MPDADVSQLQAELEEVSHDTACLLRRPDYDEGELWRLDERARELHRHLRAATARRDSGAARKQLTRVRGSGGLLSGG